MFYTSQVHVFTVYRRHPTNCEQQAGVLGTPLRNVHRSHLFKPSTSSTRPLHPRGLGVLNRASSYSSSIQETTRTTGMRPMRRRSFHEIHATKRKNETEKYKKKRIKKWDQARTCRPPPPSTQETNQRTTKSKSHLRPRTFNET